MFETTSLGVYPVRIAFRYPAACSLMGAVGEGATGPVTITVSGAATNDVEFRGVSKRYGEVQAVSGIDLGIPKGAFVALLGPRAAVRPPVSG